MDSRLAQLQAQDFKRQLLALNSNSSHGDTLMVRNHPLAQSPEMQARLGPVEHRAFAREFAQESPFSAAITLPFMIPGYTAAKAVGLHGGRSPAGLNEMAEGYRGMWEGLGMAGKEAGQSILNKLQAFGRR